MREEEILKSKAAVDTPMPEAFQGQGLTALSEQEVQRQKNEAARRLLQEWLADDSGYDEDVWPEVKQLLSTARFMLTRLGVPIVKSRSSIQTFSPAPSNWGNNSSQTHTRSVWL
jgi:hypothetical protein